MNSYIYVGQVRHRRFQPRAHMFRYSLFMMYVDLAELPVLFDKYWLWSAHAPALARFRRRDHLGDNKLPLDTAVRDLVEQRLKRRPDGPIRLLTHFAYFGFRFNPVSFYYCFEKNGETLDCIVAEINNTPWGEQFCYVLDTKKAHKNAKTSQYELEKSFHVSPFLPMDMHYDWRFSRPDKQLNVHMINVKDEQKYFDATLQLEQRPINSWQLAKVLTLFPLMTLKVVGAIYFEALRLWLKKIPFFEHPKHQEAPTKAKTI